MLNIFLTGIALLVAAWAIWFLIGLVRYVRSGDYEVHKRLDNLSR